MENLPFRENGLSILKGMRTDKIKAVQKTAERVFPYGRISDET